MEKKSTNSSFLKLKNPKAKKIIPLIVASLLSGVLGGALVILLCIYPGGPFYKHIKEKERGTVIQENKKIVVEEESAIEEAYKKVAPSVVSIVALEKVINFFGQEITSKAGGSGVIVSSDGLILTNKHVVSNEDSKYSVFTADGKSYPAKVESLDPYNDLAVIKINATGLKAAELGDSDNLQIGQRVIAIGYALAEFENTATLGIISGKDRTVEASSEFSSEGEILEGLIQTDAAINPGNSGGPLINLGGQVIGINTAMAKSAENIGFAIPINIAKKDIESVKKYGYIRKPMMGIRYVNLNPTISKANKLPVEYGALIYSGDPRYFAVIPNSPADKAGLKEGDIIIALNGEKIDENHSLVRLIQKYEPQDEVEITYIRDGKEEKVKLVLSEMK